jgi:hypothetical protein
MGFGWKLLEHVTWEHSFAIWKPGSWWAFAYPNTAAIYRAGAVPNNHPNNTAAGEALASVDAGRSIDPLFLWEGRLVIDF